MFRTNALSDSGEMINGFAEYFLNVSAVVVPIRKTLVFTGNSLMEKKLLMAEGLKKNIISGC